MRKKRDALVAVAVLALMVACALLSIPALWTDDPTDGIGGPAEDLIPVVKSGADALLGSVALASPQPMDDGLIELTIGRDQTFYEALRSIGVPHDEIMSLVRACKPYRNLKRVRRGDLFHFQLDEDNSVRSLRFDLDLESYLSFVRDGDGYAVHEGTHAVERRSCTVSGSIETSLYASLKSVGARLSLAPKMNDILGWEIDFHSDLRRGDTFRILYEEIWKDEEFVRTGPIQALEYVNRDRAYQGFRFIDDERGPGYYDAEGNSLQKQLLRAPLEYSRISSGFSWRRFHPILKRYMPHFGIDYAAPVGTPVRAAGAGRVVKVGSRKDNGRYLRIEHDNRAYESYYLHLSRFARGIREGAVIRQGQIIGYVGATGYATGPHLDYRVKKGGVFVDPRKLDLPSSDPVPKTSMSAFKTLVGICRQTFTALAPSATPHRVALAQAGTPTTPELPVVRAGPPL
ncbi:peptidoglycan DD-metalloendopeptidase family protein [Thermodesulfobacteriota bacterium]